ncbi:MAG: pyruvate ferredoxin oxidoreductase, partial [Deltaproteobacteria bacterium]|nr:pyruvate ferredoxin oxidoreductase [Deltaproteobacteria bacterium]
MAKRVGMEVSLGVSEAVKVADVDVIAAYPITPQTHIVEHLAELVANGELDAEFIPVESEHSAMSSCVGSSATGARTYTASSSQGLALMHEILYIVPALRLPVVMTVANRALSGPINIWNDHSDIMSERDIGWIQTFAENGQEAFDLSIHAFRVAEDHSVLLPVIVNLDGFTLTHVVEPFEILDRAEVAKYLPPYKPVQRLDPEHPMTMGAVGIPEVYTEAKKQYEDALVRSKSVVIQAWKEFGDLFGRYYHPVETYKTEGAETLLLTMGSVSETAMTAIDKMREAGKKVGLVRFRLWRPFPFEEFFEAVKGVKTLAVMDRAMSPGGPCGPVAAEVKAALYDQPNRPKVFSFVAGLGGRDVQVSDFEEIVSRAEIYAEKGAPATY